MIIYIVAEDYDVSMFRGGHATGLLGAVLSKELAVAACRTDRPFYIEWAVGAVARVYRVST